MASCLHPKPTHLGLVLQVLLLAYLLRFRCPQQEHLNLCPQGDIQCHFHHQEACLMIGLQCFLLCTQAITVQYQALTQDHMLVSSFISMHLYKKIAYRKLLFIGYLTYFISPCFILFQDERGLMGKSSSAK